jgi:WD40 repeat protein
MTAASPTACRTIAHGYLGRGELDWIVMKALEKDRNRRYETANGLARDVEHYLHDEPVEACPPTAGYRLRKFARKNKKLLVTTAAFVTVLLLGVAGSLWQAVRATQAEAVANANAVQAQEKEHEAAQQRDQAQKQRDEVRALNDRLQRTLYAAHMNLAHNAWDASAIGRMRELLEQHRPKPGETDLRHFEWYYLYRLSHAELLTLKGHTPFAASVAYSPDGKRLASAGASWPGLKGMEGVKVWDAQTGQELLSLKGGDGGVAFSPDGKRLANGVGLDVKVWDAQTGQELRILKGHTGTVSCVAFSPDGKRLASGDGTWDEAKNSYGTGEVNVWDAQTGQQALTLKGLTDRVGRVAFSPDGKRLASTSSGETVRVWDAQTGQELLSLKGAGWGVAYSPDGKRLASAGQRGLKVWEAQTGQELFTIKGHTSIFSRLGSSASVSSVAFSPDGKRLAAGSGDGTIKIWDATASPEARTFASAGWFSSLAFSPDGKRLAGAQGNTVKVLDVQTGKELLSLKGGARSVAFSPDGKRLVAGSKVWDAWTGRKLLTLKGGGVAFSPDGKRLVGVGGGGPGRPGRAGGGGPPRAGEVKVWDAQTGQELLSLKGAGSSVAFSPDGKRLASGGGEVKVWDAQTGQEILTIKPVHPRFNGSIVFSPDGKRLAGTDGAEAKVWDAQTGQEILGLKGHTYALTRVLFTPDGKRLAGTAVGGLVKVWDAETGEELLTLQGVRMVFSPDGQRLAGNALDGGLTIWDAPRLPEKP